MHSPLILSNRRCTSSSPTSTSDAGPPPKAAPPSTTRSTSSGRTKPPCARPGATAASTSSATCSTSSSSTAASSPKGSLRLQGLLAAWTDAGLPVTYVVGNRDPWHLDYFERELGVHVVSGGVAARLAGRETYIAHGDGLVPAERAYNRLKPLLRHPLPYRLYRNLFPGDWGYRLARHIARRGSGAPEAPTVDALRDAARHRLTGPTDLVVFGHGHRAERSDWPGGTYLNPGYWFADRTFARLDAAGPALLRWTAGEAQPITHGYTPATKKE